MTTVDFLPFANDASANVDDQATWLAAASGTGYVKLGYPHGMLPSARLNKALRQSSVMTAALAQFIAAQLSQDVLDSGGASSIATLTAQILAAVQATAQDAAFPSGTKMLFMQTAAPTGWTKDTTHNDKMLRIVSGTAGSGGSAPLSTAWSSVALSGTVQSHTLSWNEMPSHTHGGTTGGQSADHTHWYTAGGPNMHADGNGGGGILGGNSYGASSGGTSNDHTHTFTTGGAGADWGHTHGLSINSFTVTPAYADCIVGIKS
jgi:hypothetical protein